MSAEADPIGAVNGSVADIGAAVLDPFVDVLPEVVPWVVGFAVVSWVWKRFTGTARESQFWSALDGLEGDVDTWNDDPDDLRRRGKDAAAMAREAARDGDHESAREFRRYAQGYYRKARAAAAEDGGDDNPWRNARVRS